ncbi:DNA internalization-related competence protein ComEC/Rec2 [Thalassotalea piscium]|uniref:Competence protein ComEC n=1 Tax=Thalassotalea piscium TaxID=1230533 RepID=A0A7X0NKA2_9GAMM|nr:DNA internalization-related competence protein ComEC/Rec2 [Thalassotalea piscium]MBB6544998.1 competence protein ComEC [Thalassotalea piscium]
MDWWLVTFFIGAIFSLILPIEPALFYVGLLILCFLLAYINQSTRRYSALLLGCAWVLFIASQYQQIWSTNQLNSSMLAYQEVLVHGEVNTIPACEAQRCRFNFIAHQLNSQVLKQPISIRLSWDSPTQQLQQGQHWQFFVKFKPAHGLANEGGFSYQTWLRRYNIHATGYVRKNKKHQLISNVINHRQQQFSTFKAVLPSHNLSAIIQALTFGERSSLNKDHWQILQHTQIQHLIAISGLHIGIVGGFSYFLILAIIRAFPLHKLMSRFTYSNQQTAVTLGKLLNRNIRIFALLFSAGCAGYYAYLAGFSVPTLRALVMIYLFLFFRLMAINISVLSWLALSLFIIVLLMPMSLISMSFWLSIYAVVCIFFIIWRFNKLFSYHQKEKDTLFAYLFKKCRQLLYLQVMLTLLMLPLATLLSGQVSFVAVLANLVAVPLVSIIILPLSIFALLISTISTVLAIFVIDIVLVILSWLWQYLTFLAELPWAVVNLSHTHWCFIFIAVVCIIFSFVITPKQRKWMALPLILIVANISVLGFKSKSEWTVKVMDVGHGLAVIVEKNQRILLYDTGASYPSGFSMAESVLLPYFQENGVQQLDWLIISHDDNDHAGGFIELHEQLLISNLMTNDKAINASHRCIAGNSYQWQQLTLDIVSPGEIKGADNDDSCVVRISDQHNSVLLTGDISQKVEKLLVSKLQANSKDITDSYLASKVLVAPHHGSKTSSSTAFIKAIAPDYAVFSAGFLNHWRMPANTVVERYQKLNVNVLNTADSGMITFQMRSKGIEVSRYRFDDWPYWFAN